jgi:hypothetical protein
MSTPNATSRPPISLKPRRARAAEMLLLWHFGGGLLLHWRERLEPLATLRWLADLGAPALSRRQRIELAEELAEADFENGPESNSAPAMLEAATRWFCSIDLPASEEELWGGGPLFQRFCERVEVHRNDLDKKLGIPERRQPDITPIAL